MQRVRSPKCSNHDRDEKYDNYDLIIKHNFKIYLD